MRRFLREFLLFGVKQANACLFAGTFLFLVIVTHFWYPLQVLSRYDFLFVAAVLLQIVLLATRLEGWRDALVILVFHVVAMGMEVFKTSDAIGAWHYPGEAALRIGNVPLFAGFMYSAVGSYISRVWNLFDFRYRDFPPLWLMFTLSGLIYANFFTHHFLPDIRWLLLLAIAWSMRRTLVYFRIEQVHRYMPLLLGLALVALFIWFAENIATYCQVWFYPSQQHGWTVVSPQKISAWLLLMFISFTLVAAVRTVRGLDEERSL